MEVVWIFPDPVFVRSLEQECDLHAPRRSCHSHLVEAAAVATGRLHSACSLFFSRHSACSADGVVGSASRWGDRGGMDSEWDTASDPGRAGHLFLFCQTRLPRKPHLHLSALATRKRRFVPRNSAGRADASLDPAPANRKSTFCGCGCFHRNPGADPRIRELLRLSVFLCRRSLAVSG